METVRLSDDERLVTLTEFAYKQLENDIRYLKAELDKRTVCIRYGIRFNPVLYHSDFLRYETVLIANEIKKFSPDQKDEVISLVNSLIGEIKESNNEVYQELKKLTDDLNARSKELSVKAEKYKKEYYSAEIAISKIPRFLKWLYKVKHLS